MSGAWLLDHFEKPPNDPASKALKAHVQDFKGVFGEKNEGLFPDFFASDAKSAA
jgi:hypothetical protein